MVALRKQTALKIEVVSDPSVMGGTPVIRGTRIPAATVLAYLRAGRTDREIFEDYPTLPLGGVDAVKDWALRTHGPDWLITPAAKH